MCLAVQTVITLYKIMLCHSSVTLSIHCMVSFHRITPSIMVIMFLPNFTGLLGYYWDVLKQVLLLDSVLLWLIKPIDVIKQFVKNAKDLNIYLHRLPAKTPLEISLRYYDKVLWGILLDTIQERQHRRTHCICVMTHSPRDVEILRMYSLTLNPLSTWMITHDVALSIFCIIYEKSLCMSFSRWTCN